MATKNKHRRKNASNAVSREHKRCLHVDNTMQAELNPTCKHTHFNRFYWYSFFFVVLLFFSCKEDGDTLVTESNYQDLRLRHRMLVLKPVKHRDRALHLQESSCIPSDLDTDLRKPLGASSLVHFW